MKGDASALTIGKVTDLLKEEFPNLTMSKVRFLETKGLIHPARLPSGYRQYRAVDVERLRFILRRQRDQFLPLKVIETQLADWDPDEALGQGEPPTDESTPAPGPDDHVLGLYDLARQARISRDDIRQLISHGLLAPRDEEGVPKFTDRDLAVAVQCGVLIEQGLEPRHLRSIRHAVLRQAELLGGLTIAMRRNRSPVARRQAAATVNRGAEAMRRLSDLLFLAAVRTILNED